MADNTFERIEKKYLLTEMQYLAVRRLISEYMTLDKYGLSTISSIYFDSDSYELMRISAEKPVYKEKFRLRGYGKVTNTSTVYAEIKKKYNGVVYKRREAISKPDFDNWNSQENTFPTDTQIGREISYLFRQKKLSPKVYIAYDREAFFGNEDSLFRLTIDRNIRYRTDNLDIAKGDFGYPLLDGKKYLMEIKVSGAMPMWMVKILERTGVHPTSFSKVGTWYEKYIVSNNKETNNINYVEGFAAC